MTGRNEKGQFIKGYSLGNGFKKGHKINLGRKRLDMIGNKWAIGNHPVSEFKKGQEAWNKGKPNTWSNGEKSNLWKGGISAITRKERTNFMDTLEYKDWRRKVFERDNYTCQICGIRGGNLRANHIKKYADYPELRLTVDNGITICRNCDINLVLGKEIEWENYFKELIPQYA